MTGLKRLTTALVLTGAVMLPAASAGAATQTTKCGVVGALTPPKFQPISCTTKAIETGPSGAYTYTARATATAVGGKPAAKLEFFTEPGGAFGNPETCASSGPSCTASRTESGGGFNQTSIWIRCTWNSSAFVALAILDCSQTLTTQ